MSKKEKLVRDKILEISRKEKDGKSFRVAEDSEMPSLFVEKLREETEEVCEELNKSPLEREKVIEEIGDLLEVIDSMCSHFGFTKKEIKRIKSKKRKRKGSFKSKLVVDLSKKS